MSSDPYDSRKILIPYHFSRVRDILHGRIPMPSLIEIDLSDKGCSQSCIFCAFSNSNGQNMQLIDQLALISFLRSAFTAGVRAFEFSGGAEPLNHPSFADIANSIQHFDEQRGARIGLVTNGLRLKYVLDTVRSFSWVRISLDASDANVYSELHGVAIGGGHFQTVVENIRLLVENSRSSLVRLGYLVVPPHNHTRQQVFSACILAKELGVLHIAFRPASFPWKAGANQWKEAQSVIMEAKRVFGESFVLGGTDVSWTQATTSGEHHGEQCWSRPMVLVIKADGTIPSCVLYRNRTSERGLLGTICESFDAVWFSEVHMHSLASFKTDSCPAICKHHRTNEMIALVRQGMQRSISYRPEQNEDDYFV